MLRTLQENYLMSVIPLLREKYQHAGIDDDDDVINYRARSA